MMLSDVCLSRTSGLSQGQKGLGRLTELAHVTRDSDTTFKVKVTGGGGILWRPPHSLLLWTFDVVTTRFNTLSDGDAIAVLHIHMMVWSAVTPSINSREYQQYQFNKVPTSTPQLISVNW